MVLSDKEIVRELLNGNITITPLLRSLNKLGVLLLMLDLEQNLGI